MGWPSVRPERDLPIPGGSGSGVAKCPPRAGPARTRGFRQRGGRVSAPSGTCPYWGVQAAGWPASFSVSVSVSRTEPAPPQHSPGKAPDPAPGGQGHCSGLLLSSSAHCLLLPGALPLLLSEPPSLGVLPAGSAFRASSPGQREARPSSFPGVFSMPQVCACSRPPGVQRKRPLAPRAPTATPGFAEFLEDQCLGCRGR